MTVKTRLEKLETQRGTGDIYHYVSFESSYMRDLVRQHGGDPDRVLSINWDALSPAQKDEYTRDWNRQMAELFGWDQPEEEPANCLRDSSRILPEEAQRD